MLLSIDKKMPLNCGTDLQIRVGEISATRHGIFTTCSVFSNGMKYDQICKLVQVT